MKPSEEKEPEYDLRKLGIVIGAHNEITKDMLNMLKEQQKRQVRMIWSSLAIVALAIIVVGLAVFCTFSSLDKITTQVDRNTKLILHNSEVIQDAYKSETGKELP